MKKRQRLHRVCLEENDQSIRSKEEKRMCFLLVEEEILVRLIIVSLQADSFRGHRRSMDVDRLGQTRFDPLPVEQWRYRTGRRDVTQVVPL